MPIAASAQKDPPKSKTVSYPADHPLISVSVPDGWSAPGSTIRDMPLLVMPPKGVKGRVKLDVKDGVTDPQAAFKKTLDDMEAQGVKWETKAQAFSLNGMKGFEAKGSGTKEGEDWRISQLILSVDGKRYFSVSIQFRAADLPSITSGLEAVMNSIKPLP